MSDYALVCNGRVEVSETGALDTVMKQINPSVKAISILHYTQPQVVVVHCGNEELAEPELDALRAALPNAEP